MRGKDRGKAKADRRERGNMGVMSEMLNFGMGRPGDDDMKFHDLDGECSQQRLLKQFHAKCHAQSVLLCVQLLLKHAEGVCSEQR